MHSSSTDLQTLAIPLFELQKLISAQTLESETKLHPTPSEPRGYTYSLSWALHVNFSSSFLSHSFGPDICHSVYVLVA